MTSFISPVFWYILTIGVLVTVHEWGHFIVARWCGVHVIRFSVGFGRAIYKRTGKNGTEYQLAMIPLGGYVKMLDERELPNPDSVSNQADSSPFISEALLAKAFNRQSVQKRIAIVAAGPIANLLLCIALLWISLTIGSTELRPLLGPAQGLALQAGFELGDEIQSIDQTAIKTWDDALPMLALAAMDQRAIDIGVITSSGGHVQRHLQLNRLNPDFDQSKLLQSIGFSPFFSEPSAIIGNVMPGSPADQVLQSGDRITRIDDVSITMFSQISEVLKKSAKPGKNLKVEIIRQNQTLSFFIEPKRVEDKSGSQWRLGIASMAATKTVKYGTIEALPAAVKKTFSMASDSLSIIGRLITGSASVQNLSGPISIAQAADNQAAWGFSAFLSFLAAISLALCIMNLLPIPVLDGGHLLYFAIEWITGKQVSEAFQVIGQYIGIFLLIGLMGIALYNDFFRIIS